MHLQDCLFYLWLSSYTECMNSVHVVICFETRCIGGKPMCTEKNVIIPLVDGGVECVRLKREKKCRIWFICWVEWVDFYGFKWVYYEVLLGKLDWRVKVNMFWLKIVIVFDLIWKTMKWFEFILHFNEHREHLFVMT